jgi:hypothetical protein
VPRPLLRLPGTYLSEQSTSVPLKPLSALVESSICL